MEAQTLNCPMCGAPATDNSPACGHCGARLAKIACPSCFGMVFDGSKFCPHCGVELARKTLEKNTDLLCPKCDLGMDEVQLGSASLFECATCHGLWLDVDTLEEVCREREKQALILGDVKAIAPVGTAEIKYHYVPCPLCRQLMHRVNFARCSGVVVDVCKPHGTWFDRDELQRIIGFIRSGGLEAAREEEKRELELARQRLEAAKSAAALSLLQYNSPSYGCNHDLDLVSMAGSLLSGIFRR